MKFAVIAIIIYMQTIFFKTYAYIVNEKILRNSQNTLESPNYEFHTFLHIEFFHL